MEHSKICIKYSFVMQMRLNADEGWNTVIAIHLLCSLCSTSGERACMMSGTQVELVLVRGGTQYNIHLLCVLYTHDMCR